MSDNQFSQRIMTKLKIKVKLIVFYGSKEDMDSLMKLRDECNTSVCQYSLIPIYIGSEDDKVNVANINKHIKTCVSGYEKDFDKVCLVNTCINQDEKCLIFDSIGSFKAWFYQSQNKKIL